MLPFAVISSTWLGPTTNTHSNVVLAGFILLQFDVPANSLWMLCHLIFQRCNAFPPSTSACRPVLSARFILLHLDVVLHSRPVLPARSISSHLTSYCILSDMRCRSLVLHCIPRCITPTPSRLTAFLALHCISAACSLCTCVVLHSSPMQSCFLRCTALHCIAVGPLMSYCITSRLQ